jgi:hypothetical protein
MKLIVMAMTLCLLAGCAGSTPSKASAWATASAVSRLMDRLATTPTPQISPASAHSTTVSNGGRVPHPAVVANPRPVPSPATKPAPTPATVQAAAQSASPPNPPARPEGTVASTPASTPTSLPASSPTVLASASPAAASTLSAGNLPCALLPPNTVPRCSTTRRLPTKPS